MAFLFYKWIDREKIKSREKEHKSEKNEGEIGDSSTGLDADDHAQDKKMSKKDRRKVKEDDDELDYTRTESKRRESSRGLVTLCKYYTQFLVQ